jgi:hypothetical protein
MLRCTIAMRSGPHYGAVEPLAPLPGNSPRELLLEAQKAASQAFDAIRRAHETVGFVPTHLTDMIAVIQGEARILEEAIGDLLAGREDHYQPIKAELLF